MGRAGVDCLARSPQSPRTLAETAIISRRAAENAENAESATRGNTEAGFGERPSSTVAARSRRHGRERVPALSRSHAAHFVTFALPDTERAIGPTRKRASPFTETPMPPSMLVAGAKSQAPSRSPFRAGATRRFRVPAQRGFRVLWQRRRCWTSQAWAMPRPVLARGCGVVTPMADDGGPPRQRFQCLARSALLCGLRGLCARSSSCRKVWHSSPLLR